MRANGDARAARIWTVMAYAGLRRGEAARLTLRALDRHAGVLHVFGKSGEHETVPLHPEVSRAVRAEAAANGVRTGTCRCSAGSTCARRGSARSGAPG
jgi:integrase